MVGKNDLLERVSALSEEESKELLLEILYSYSVIGMGSHNTEKFLRDVKGTYLELLMKKFDI